MIEYHVINLDELAELLEGTGARRDEITAQCPDCQETLTQLDHICPGCFVHIVWEHSKVWKREWGRPDLYIRRLTTDLSPATPLEEHIVRIFGNFNVGKWEFANVTQQREFRIIAKKYEDSYIRELADWAHDKGWRAFLSGIRNSDNYANWMHRKTEGMGGAYG